jgi:hypothetical protein
MPRKKETKTTIGNDFTPISTHWVIKAFQYNLKFSGLLQVRLNMIVNFPNCDKTFAILAAFTYLYCSSMDGKNPIFI